MLDPLLALGVASNIVQFVDFSWKLVSGSIEVYGSLEGATKDHIDVESVTADLSKLSSRLSKDAKAITQSTSGAIAQRLAGVKQSEHQDALGKLALRCKQLADDLVNTLQQLKVTGNFKALKSGIAMIKAALKSEDIARYKSSLDNIRSEMTIRMVAIVGEQQREMFEHLRRQFEDESRSHETLKVSTANLERCMASVLAQVSSTSSDMELLMVHINGLAQEWKDSMSLIKTINSLSFESIHARWEGVDAAYSKTFEWAFQDVQGLGEWLKSGNQTFWITGKPGSGKSTFMKFLFMDERTKQHLEIWSGGQKLVSASHFFWASGTPMQRSLAGLLRSLLADLIRAHPEIVPIIIPNERLESTLGSKKPWTIPELRECFYKLKRQTEIPLKVCLFVDGLDEYDGDHEDVLEMFDELGQGENVKICLSSRDWNVFLDWFKECKSLRVDHLTKADIRYFAQSKLQEDRRFALLRQKNADYDSIVDLIIREAEGVFLWVHLVVQSLKRGFIEGDTIKDLLRRIKQLPKKLEDFFLLILNSVEEVYHQDAAEILKICQTHLNSQPSVVALSFFDREDHLFGTNCEEERWTFDELDEIHTSATRRIRARCRDLIAFRPLNGEPSVEFIHRTARDFVQSANASKLLQDRLRKDFDPLRYLCQASIAHAKLMPREERKKGVINEFEIYAVQALWYSELYEKSCNDNEKQSMRWLDDLNTSLESEGFCGPEQFRQREPLIRRSWLFNLAERRSGTMYLGHCIAPFKDSPKWTEDLGPRLISNLTQGGVRAHASQTLTRLQSAYFILTQGSICGETRVNFTIKDKPSGHLWPIRNELPLCLGAFAVMFEDTWWVENEQYCQVLRQYVDEMLRRTNVELLKDNEFVLLVDHCQKLQSQSRVATPGLASFLASHNERAKTLRTAMEAARRKQKSNAWVPHRPLVAFRGRMGHGMPRRSLRLPVDSSSDEYGSE